MAATSEAAPTESHFLVEVTRQGKRESTARMRSICEVLQSEAATEGGHHEALKLGRRSWKYAGRSQVAASERVQRCEAFCWPKASGPSRRSTSLAKPFHSSMAELLSWKQLVAGSTPVGKHQSERLLPSQLHSILMHESEGVIVPRGWSQAEPCWCRSSAG